MELIQYRASGEAELLASLLMSAILLERVKPGEDSVSGAVVGGIEERDRGGGVATSEVSLVRRASTGEERDAATRRRAEQGWRASRALYSSSTISRSPISQTMPWARPGGRRILRTRSILSTESRRVCSLPLSSSNRVGRTICIPATQAYWRASVTPLCCSVLSSAALCGRTASSQAGLPIPANLKARTAARLLSDNSPG
jgi:hypothetical protein